MIKKLLIGLVLLVVIVIGLSFAFPGKLLELASQAERSKANLVEKTIEVNGETWHYMVGGNPNGETLIMVHGFGGDMDNWTRFAPHMADKYKLIAMDLPGFGKSARHKDWNYVPSKQVPRLHDFVQAIGETRYHITGNSMGGHIAGLYTHTYQDEIITLGLIDNAGASSPIKPAMRKQMDAGGPNPLLVNSVEDFDNMLDWVFVKKPYIPGPLKKHFVKEAIKNRPFNDFIFDQYTAERRGILDPLLPQITVPTLVLWGDQDKLIHVSTVEVMAPLLPNETVVILPNVGHSPMIEVPELTATKYREFLAANGH